MRGSQDGLQDHLGSRCFTVQHPVIKPPSRCEGDGTMSSFELLTVAGLETLHRVSRVNGNSAVADGFAL